MTTYLELAAQAEALAAEVEAARQAEFQTALDEVRAKVAEYGMTERDIFGTRRMRSAKRSTRPKYSCMASSKERRAATCHRNSVSRHL
ncbi:H-NS family nucleoid-associated regulatory protein [Burkholderia gladioli]|uniref:H-NS family nucleoid-associated regulatory protein n=1 Tax=Burkholderia gladioli TaxID=28095 RepID=UPI000CFE5672|nr:H-NS family nucleoid-associated regulatory protein [Burkholderia gladioli]MBU9179312.1 H-NS histone family protein [Burkholderia gladioli]MBU9324098.1 H-NS histone family protein [Burkholderia gladioli]PRH08580.1 hypothetical protein C6V08_06760 [Burkholderia gladioli]